MALVTRNPSPVASRVEGQTSTNDNLLLPPGFRFHKSQENCSVVKAQLLFFHSSIVLISTTFLKFNIVKSV